ncbi:MAG: flagellar hook-length control protein FliK [Phycisphaerales bacterium]
MTANANLVSDRATTPASAIQARASSQSAAIALLGAGTSSLNEGESSFADSLASESKRQNSPQSLFSDKANTVRPNSAAELQTRKDSRRKDDPDPRPSAQATDDPRPDPIDRKPRSAIRQETRSDDASTTNANPIDTTAVAENVQSANPSTPNVNPAATEQQAQASNTAAQTSAEETKTQAASSKAQKPTDPLRLIVPQQQAASEDAPITGQTVVSQGVAQNATTPQTTTKQPTTRASENSSNSTGTTTQVNSTMTVGSAVGVHNGAVTAATANEGTSAVGGITASTGSGGGTTGGTPLDQVLPPKIGGGKAIEHPVTLKLKLGPPTSSSTPQLTETEITAAETQIGRGLTAAFRQNTPQVTLWMSPETLGKVRIQLTFDQGNISARFEATSDATKDLLAQNMGALRDALQSRGLTAQHIEVVSIPDWSNQNGAQSGGNQGKTAGDPTPQQPSTGGGSTAGQGDQGSQGGHPQQNPSLHSNGWAALPQGNTPLANGSSDVQVAMAIDSRLMTLKAHLELDAVA